DAAERERKLWIGVGALMIVGFLLSRYTLQSVQGPLGRLVTAAERFGAGDLRPVTTGDMPREFRVLADAMRRMGDGLRWVVSARRSWGRRSAPWRTATAATWPRPARCCSTCARSYRPPRNRLRS